MKLVAFNCQVELVLSSETQRMLSSNGCAALCYLETVYLSDPYGQIAWYDSHHLRSMLFTPDISNCEEPCGAVG